MSKRRIIKNALKVKYGDSRRAKWWLKDESLISVVHSVQPYICRCSESTVQRSFEIIKEEDNRLVFCVKSTASKEKSFVVKVFPLRCLRHSLKYHVMKYSHSRFAFGEAGNLFIAAKRGVSVPRVYGYGHVYGISMLIRKSILILEDLNNHTPIGTLLELNRTDQQKCGQILSRAIPIFISLYKACCNHISVNPGSIMFGDEDSKEDDFILDLEYARFYDMPSLELLMFEAATLARYCRFLLTKETIDGWIHELLDAAEIRDHVTREKMIQYFNYHLNTQLSRNEREKIGAS